MSGTDDTDTVNPGADFQRLLDDLAELYPHVGKGDFYARFVGFFRQRINILHASLCEFRPGLQPRVLFAEGVSFDADLQIYLKGAYLLDPFFYRYQYEGYTGSFFVDRDEIATVYSWEGYWRYWRFLAGDGEFACLYPIAPGICHHLSMLSKFSNASERAEAVALVKSLHKTAANLLSTHVSLGSSDSDEVDLDERRNLYLTINQLLEEFGAEVLTTRERQIAKLVLKGQSAKSIARELCISPGTVGIHRSNIYQKLGISGQGELLELFFEKIAQ